MRTVTRILIAVAVMWLGLVLLPSSAHAAPDQHRQGSYTAARPSAGIISRNPAFFGGQGQLVIDNTRGDRDAVVGLLGSDNKTAAAWVRVAKGGQFTLQGLRDGDYHLYYIMGQDYQRVTHPDPLSFRTIVTTTSTTTGTITRTRTTVWKLILRGCSPPALGKASPCIASTPCTKQQHCPRLPRH